MSFGRLPSRPDRTYFVPRGPKRLARRDPSIALPLLPDEDVAQFPGRRGRTHAGSAAAPPARKMTVVRRGLSIASRIVSPLYGLLLERGA